MVRKCINRPKQPLTMSSVWAINGSQNNFIPVLELQEHRCSYDIEIFIFPFLVYNDAFSHQDELTISWEKFCSSIRSKKSWRKITNFLKTKRPPSYPTRKLGNKTAKTDPEKAQLFVERNFCIESHLFQKSYFDGINKFVEAHSYHFTPLDSLHDHVTDTNDNSDVDLVADVDPDTLIRLVRSELKHDKAPGVDNVHNDILKKAIGTGFYKLLARAFTISLNLGCIPYVWKVAVLCMLIKPDKPLSQTTSYRPISLLSAIMKLFERVIEKRLRKHFEDNGFFSKCHSSFRKSKSTNDHFFRLSQTIMESFNRGEHVIAAQWTQVQNLPA